MFSKCKICGKKFWFKKIEICDECKIEQKRIKDEARQKRMQESHAKRMEKRKLARKQADIQLKKEISKIENKQIQPKIEVKEKKVIKKKKESVKREIKKKYVPKNTESFLLIEATMKGFKVTEWYKERKRVLLNRTRELRRTHAGGYSAEKFQKHVDIMKRMTFEWMSGYFEKEGLLKDQYDDIEIICDNDELNNQITEYVNKRWMFQL